MDEARRPPVEAPACGDAAPAARTREEGDPVGILMAEHRAVEIALDGLLILAHEFREAAEPREAEARELIAFLRHFADGCHHAKEEELLFPFLESHGMNRNMGPTAAMRVEHRIGAGLIGDMERGLDGRAQAGGDEAGRRAFVAAAEAYVGLLRAHIRKEDHCLFAFADRVLDDTGRASLAEAFREADQAFRAAEGGRRSAAAAEALAMAVRLRDSAAVFSPGI
jgi:hemerythrin-like domain-containing protein